MVWSLPPTHVTKEERDHGDQLHRGPFPSRAHAHGSPLVSGLSAEHAPCRSTHARTWVHVDHSTVHRWVIHYRPHLEKALPRRKRPVWVRWRRDETSIKVKGVWRYLSRAVDQYGETIDFLLTEHWDTEAALKFLKKAIRQNGLPETITIDGSDANEAAIKSYNEEHGTAIAIRQVKYLNNIVEQDHRGVKRVTRPMLGFKSFAAAQDTLVGIELMHMIKKRQLVVEEGNEGLTAAELFYSLAA